MAAAVGEGARPTDVEACTDISVLTLWTVNGCNGRVLVSLLCHSSATWPKKMPTGVPARMGLRPPANHSARAEATVVHVGEFVSE